MAGRQISCHITRIVRLSREGSHRHRCRPGIASVARAPALRARRSQGMGETPRCHCQEARYQRGLLVDHFRFLVVAAMLFRPVR